MRTAALIVLAASALCAEEATRGLKPLVVRDAEQRAVAEFTSHHALIIGNSRYTAGWSELAGVRDDVPSVRAALERHGFEVTVAQDVTKAQMIDAIDTFIADKCQDVASRAVVYYAGHGQTLNGVGYLVPVDAPLSEDRAFIRKALPITSLKTSAVQARSRHVLFAFDACFAGSIFVPLRGVSSYVLRSAAEPVRMFLTAGSANEQVPDQSFFRYEFIAGINGRADLNQDGYVTGSELGTYVKQAVSDRAAVAGMRLSPQAGVSEQEGMNRGDFVFRVAPLDEASATAAAPIAPAGPVTAALPKPVVPSPVDGLPPTMASGPVEGVPVIPNTPEGTAAAFERMVGMYEVPRALDPQGQYRQYSFEIDRIQKRRFVSDTPAQLSIVNDSARQMGGPIILRMTVDRLEADGRSLVVHGSTARTNQGLVRLEPQPDGTLRWTVGEVQYVVTRVKNGR